METNFELLLVELVKPLINHTSDLEVNLFTSDENVYVYHVLVNEQDLGRVIGKGGRTANAIRTIAYAAASKDSVRIQINFDAKKENTE
jgi:predicted RNA-binding protein YlqC (UPF0109 family)